MNADIQYVVNQYVSKVKENKAAAELKGVRPAVYQGNKQVAINGMMYDIDMASSISLRIGQVVYVALDQTGTKAVVVG